MKTITGKQLKKGSIITNCMSDGILGYPSGLAGHTVFYKIIEVNRKPKKGYSNLAKIQRLNWRPDPRHDAFLLKKIDSMSFDDKRTYLQVNENDIAMHHKVCTCRNLITHPFNNDLPI